MHGPRVDVCEKQGQGCTWGWVGISKKNTLHHHCIIIILLRAYIQNGRKMCSMQGALPHHSGTHC